jgi:alanyl-tRNA synthetase
MRVCGRRRVRGTHEHKTKFLLQAGTMKSAEIRDRAFRFFGDRGHIAVASASLVADDPTLLLVNAGVS